MRRLFQVALFVMLSFCVLFPVMSAAAAQSQGMALTKKHPIRIDVKHRRVTFLAEVNGKYFYQPTRHCAVFEGGTNGEKAIFRAFVDPVTFYHALTRIGLKPGNNMTLANKTTTHVAGDRVAVTVTWKGAKRSYPLDEVVLDQQKKPIVMRFGGNLKRAKKLWTGCLLCLDSCPVGIVSNATYTYGAVEERHETAFKGNPRILPPDGTPVFITVAAEH